MKPMKPSTIEDVSKLRFPLLGSPKLDGFRARVSKAAVMTSNWKPVVNEFIQGRLIDATEGLDGELIVGKPSGPGVLKRTSSGVTTREGEPDFTFWVFDLMDPSGEHPFKRRLDIVKGQLKVLGNPRIKLVSHKLIRNLDEYHRYCDAQILGGFEGAMFRDPDGPYKFGRSTPREGYLWRYKPFVDSEMEIEDWYEQEHNGNAATTDELGRTKRSSHKAGKTGKGVLGGFIGRDIHSGQPVRVGTGIDDADRKAWWAMGLSAFKGRLAKYKKQLAGEADKPRHAVFLDFRDKNDL